MRKNVLRIALLALSLTLCLVIPLLANSVRAQNAAGTELAAVWARVQESGAYRFNADIVQANTPQATVLNAGRKSTEHAYYLEGESDIRAESLHLTLWTGGGSVQMPGTGVEMRIEGDQARARQGNGSWEEIDNFSGLFAPGGDFLAYTQAAQNVVRHAPEVRATPLGDVRITRYTFDIDGRQFAIRMRKEMREQTVREGLPANVSMELPRVYAEMTGTGELWVGADGLPLRQTFALAFPPDPHDYVATAEIAVDFSNFAPLPVAGWSSRMVDRIVDSVVSAGRPRNVLTMLMLTISLWFAAIVIVRRRSRMAYAAVAAGVILSMLMTPLLGARRVAAFAGVQAEKAAVQEEQQAAQEARAALPEAMAAIHVDPHADPLAVAQAAAVPTAQNDTGSRYFDPSCASDPTGDIDGDGLTNLSECLVGTLPDTADTDTDGLTDFVEVTGFTYNNQTWYSDPLNMDSNYDSIGDGKEWHMDADGNGIPDDTDGDGTPDLWDDDNDGDGVLDKQDLSPYVTTKHQAAFSGAQPFELTIDGLVESELVRVEFQFRPTDADHLWYSQSVLDWPKGDQQAQLQDTDGMTFADVDPTLPPWPNANGDVRLIPMLEIELSSSTETLPPKGTCTTVEGDTYDCYPILNDFGISVQQTDDDTLTAYVPVQVVSDDTGDANIAFYARMFYQAGASWGDAQNVRLVWVVQMLNDICSAYDNGICSEYSAQNELQVIQTYDDEWYLTGLHVVEEHSADIALIYEDPQVTPTIEPGADDKPLYLDVLYGLLYGLDNSFLAGRDCDTVDGDGNCVGNGQLDITVDTIGDRFNHATNSYDINDPAYWGLPNVLSVVKNGVERTLGDGLGAYADIASYESIDLGMMDTTITQTIQLLDNTFTDVWSASDPITPTVMLAYEQTYRDLNLDQTINADPNLAWNGQSLTLNLPQSGAHQVQVDTMASVQWTPYAYDPATGWAPANLQQFWYTMNDELVDSFADISDPDEAQTMQTMAQAMYLTTANGMNSIVQIGDNVNIPGYQEPDEPFFITVAGLEGKIIQFTVDKYYSFSKNVFDIASRIQYSMDWGEENIIVAAAQEIGVEVNYFVRDFSETMLAGATAFGIVVGVAVVFGLIVQYLVHNASSGLALAGKLSVGIGMAAVSLVFSIVKPIITVWNTAKAAVAAGATEAEAFFSTLAESSTLLGSVKVVAVIGLVLSIGLAVGMFVYAWASGAVSPGSIAFNELIAQTLAAIIVAVLYFVLSFSVIGTILLAILALVDTILMLAHAKFTISGWVTKTIAGVVYHYDLDTSQDVTTGEFDIELAEPDLGMIAGNGLTQTLPLTTTLTQVYSSDQSNSKRIDRLKQNSMIYDLSLEEKTLSTSAGARSDEWIVSQSGTDGLGQPMYKAVVEDDLTVDTILSAGVNTGPPLWLNTAYALLGENCWVGFCTVEKTVSGSSSDAMGVLAVLDVLPASLSEFVDVHAWGTVTFLDADGDGMLPTSAGGLDPDDTTWDMDKDWLSDAYEISLRSLPVELGGVALDPGQADSDGDGLNDYAELRSGTDPGKDDTDGDGLVDLEEALLVINDGKKLVLNGGSGWLIPYAYDAASGTTAQTRVWSDPLQVDADADGMSDLFEEAQTTLTANPWADPDNPLVYNPNVWNESPVALYLDDDSIDGFVKPGVILAYTTTTINNLSSGQELVGELSLSLPSGVSGGPTSQIADIQSGESSNLVSTLTFDSTESRAYEFSSRMELTDYDQTRWTWDDAIETNRSALSGTPHAIAIAPVVGWDAAFVMVTLERSSSAQTIVVYTVDNDGTVMDSVQLVSEPLQGSLLIGPDIACNDDGACLAVFGEVGGFIWAARLDSGLHSPSALKLKQYGNRMTGPSVATDGTDFMVAWGESTSATTANQYKYGVHLVSGTGIQEGGDVLGTVNTNAGATAIEWTGSSYTVVYTGGGNLNRISVDATGATTTGSSVIAAGGGWRQSDGRVRAPALAYDAISDRSLIAYRDADGGLTARIVTAESVGEALPLVASGVNGQDVSVVLSADPKNSGWVLAWSAGGAAEYRALAPTGALRGDISTVDQSALTTVGLSCIVPGAELDLALDEAAGATVFADSSPQEHLVTCDEPGMTCPEAGYTGKNGNAAAFDGGSAALVVPDGINLANRSHSFAAWVNRDDVGDASTVILSQASEPYVTNQDVLFSIQGSKAVCGFRNNVTYTKNGYDQTGWHHWVCTYDVTADQHVIYRDGVQVPTEHIGAASGPYIGSGPLFIGRFVDGTSPFSGLLEDVQIYDRVLSAKEIQDVFDRPVGVFDLDETRGSIHFVNSADTGFSGECQPGACPMMGVPGVAYTAAQFDGTNSIIITATPEVTATRQWGFEDKNVQGWEFAFVEDITPSIELATRGGKPNHYLDADATETGGLQLLLTDLPAHDQIDLSYDIYVLGDQWRGADIANRTIQQFNDTSTFQTYWNGTELLVATSFSNEKSDVTGAYQNFPNIANAYWNGWNGKGSVLWSNQDCSGQSAFLGTDSGRVKDGSNGTQYLGDITAPDPQATFNVNCVATDPNVVAMLYTGANFSGSTYLQDPKRNVSNRPQNVRIVSAAVGMAAFPPRHGSTGQTLVVDGNSDNSVYSIKTGFDHSGNQTNIVFRAEADFGLDNVTVELIKDANSFPLRNASFTLSAWAKAENANQGGLLIAQGPDEPHQGLRFGFSSSDVYCGFTDNGLPVPLALDTDWHHWVCTYDASTKTRTVYRDGVQVGQNTAPANYSGYGPTYIGQGFVGAIDEVGIWTEALDADEIKELFEKVKVEDQSVLTCQLPVATNTGTLSFQGLTLRETTTRIGDVSQTVTRTITVDNDLPVIQIQTPSNGQYVSGNDIVSVAGAATDATSYVSGVQVRSDSHGGTWVDTTGNANWSYNWDPSGQSEGRHTVTVQAVDAVGNESAAQSVEFVLDRTAPTVWAASAVQPTQDAAGHWYVPVRGNVSDPNAGSEPGSGVATVEVLLQGRQEASGNGWQAATFSGDTWTLDYTLPRIGDNRQVIVDPSGVYTVTLRGADNVDNITPAASYPSQSITLDVAGPTLTVSEPVSLTEVISTAITVRGSVSDLSGVATVEVNLTPAEQIDSLIGNVLHLPMDENRASAFFDDQSGTGHDATCTGNACPTVGEPGQRDGAFGFDGTNTFLDAGDAIAELAKADFSMGAWVKTTGAEIAIVTKSNGDNQWQTGEKSFYLDGAGVPNFVGWGDSYIRGTTAVNDGNWHHVLVTWDYSGSGTAGTGNIYVDGVDDTASTTNFQAQHGDNAGDTLKIGRPNYGTEAPHFFAGLLDEVIVYDRALADYEAANLYAYGQVVWESATVDNGAWGYTIPEGENGVEGFYQLNVRGTDTLGNATPLSGQRGWRGEIDTKPPSVQFVVTTNDSGNTSSTKYECVATDFNLLQESDSNGYQTTSCVPGVSNVPAYKNSDLTLTTYADVDPWYAATITDTARLYGMDAVRTDAGGPADDLQVTACDRYDRCTTATPELSSVDPVPPAGAEVLTPASGSVLTSTVPVTVSGDVYAENGLRALWVMSNDRTAHLLVWDTPGVTSELWQFAWTPPGEGIYRFETVVDDWAGIPVPKPAHSASTSDTLPEDGESAIIPLENPASAIYLPWVASPDNGSAGPQVYLPVVIDTGPPSTDIYAGTVATFYVDLTPPEVAIGATVLNADRALGPRIVELTGTAGDTVLLHRVDVRIDDGPWQRAGIDGAGNWRFPWRLAKPPTGESYAVSVRATDLAGRTTVVTATVVVDFGRRGREQ